jgi:hypothetical protein
MQKRGKGFLLIALLILGVSFIIVQAQETFPPVGDIPPTDSEPEENSPQDNIIEDGSNDDFDEFDDDFEQIGEESDNDIGEEVDEEHQDAELIHSAGITPDSAFYFVDKFFDRFGDELENREEKISEIKSMIEEGKYEAAREALENYNLNADVLEKEIDPEKREETRRSAAAIRKTLRNLEDEIPVGERQEFVNDILEREKSIITSVEIAGKIKELCLALSDLDPSEYARVCKTKENAPKWQKRLDADLTESQKEKAKEFGEIMSQCFQTSGETCRCEDISFTEFAEQCSIIAPLAYACDVLDDETSCDKLDKIEEENDPFELLPDYLQDVLDDIEGQYSDAKFDHHIPGPCKAAGITGKERGDRDACFKIMVEKEAPKPCSDALKSGRIKISNERAFREACEKIMFEEEAPQECIDAGLKDFRECGPLLFKLNAPQECIDAGLTGKQQSDRIKCEKIMREFHEEGRGPPEGRGFGPDCGRIQDSKERLKCYDQASQGANKRFDDRRGFNERFEETKARERQCAESCHADGGAWDFSNGECTCKFRDFENDFPDDRRDDFRRDFNENDNFREHDENRDVPRDNSRGVDCSTIFCQEGTHCEPDFGCVPNNSDRPDNSGDFPPEEEFRQEDFPKDNEPPQENFEEPQQEPSSEPPQEPSSEPPPTTGAVITGNAFYEYYYN